MSKSRMEAFSDGVIAILITIMVLELAVPHGEGLEALVPLVPFVTGWMGENHFAAWPVAAYGVVLMIAAIAYYILSRALIRHHGKDSALAVALGNDFKGKISVGFYVAAFALAFWNRWFSVGIYVLTALMWLVPDRRIEKTLSEPPQHPR